MNYNAGLIIFIILLFDSLGANIVTWGNLGKKYQKYFSLMSRYFPLAKGWTTYYLILVLFIGLLVYQLR